jgi:hypothetical protein
MLSKLKTALGSILGGAGSNVASTPAVAPVEYKGYRITPAPYKAGAQFQTAGRIEKETPDGVKVHELIRADTYSSFDDAVAFATTKAKQIIDQQGDRMFS